LLVQNGIFLMSDLVDVSSLIGKSRYVESPDKFFRGFHPAWREVKCQVLKMETRQVYVEPGNKSYDLMVFGKKRESLRMMRRSLAADDILYKSLAKRGVDFIRCRPAKRPFSDYLKWELQTYRITSLKGERIFICDYEKNKTFFTRHATHDFMVFDNKVAFVHDYDELGLIRGGWVVKDASAILGLQSLFMAIKSRCRPYHFFL
jgi:hypothetical protein